MRVTGLDDEDEEPKKRKNLSQKEKKDLVLQCILTRYTVKETHDYILRVTGVSLSEETITRYIKNIKENSAEFIQDLQTTRFEYTSIYLERYNEMLLYLRRYNKLYDLAEDKISNVVQRIIVQKDLNKEMLTVTKALGELASALPQIIGFVPRSPKEIDRIKKEMNEAESKKGLVKSDKYSDIQTILQDK